MGGRLVARTAAPHLCPETKGQPGELRTACSFPANVTGTSRQLALGEPCPESPGLGTLNKAFSVGVVAVARRDLVPGKRPLGLCPSGAF